MFSIFSADHDDDDDGFFFQSVRFRYRFIDLTQIRCFFSQPELLEEPAFVIFCGITDEKGFEQR